ncbi:MAG TPA: phosphopantetheine-binding protein [Candidatus Limnocylindria bacterium]|jgi:acyl carrier protein|nr:phosphopantetheine-binding protein [Candidatus Limnocylindria bacterium]
MGSEASIEELKGQLKAIVVEALMLQITPAELGDEQPFFGPGSLGLDSVDALQLVVALDKNFGIKITDTEVARNVLANIASMADAVVRHRANQAP